MDRSECNQTSLASRWSSFVSFFLPPWHAFNGPVPLLLTGVETGLVMAGNNLNATILKSAICRTNGKLTMLWGQASVPIIAPSSTYHHHHHHHDHAI